jgi:tetratricopeptide (TPR) repeat protein
MDWGLAKIVQAEEKPLDEGDRFAVAMGADPAETNKGSGTGLPRVHTSRAAENELTTEGTVLGTPVYMPPEQATGRLKQIGPRSDVYALGAILYEILTLKPPVDRAGGFQKVLARVVEGNISQPSVRNPERARDGKIPAELAAVAMKALAKDPENRYGSVELLRRDIELFQEGRSVSAKEDTRGEQFLKFVKRNKTFTLAAASAAALVALILLASALINFQAARAAQKAYDDRIAIEREVQQLRRTSVPVLMESARLFLERRRFANALAHLDLALDYDPDHADALLLHGQLLLAEKKDFAGARKDFERYLKHRSEQRDVQDLAKRCGRADADDPTNMLMVAEIFTNQKMPLLADRLLFNYGETPALAKEFLRKIYHDRVEEAWPGMGGRLSLDPGGLFTLNLINGQKVTVLTPIEGMPLSKLYLHACSSVNDLTPLKNMPLTYLDLARTNVTDLSPIEDLPLTYLELRQTRLSDLKPLQKMKLTFLGMHLCPNVVDLSPLAGIPLATLQLSTSPIKDISALKMLPLTDVDLNTCKELQDVGPLKGTKIAKLNLSSCLKLKDLAPLADLPLKKLSLDNCKLITDITMLRGLPLEEISLEGCTGITDLTPLQGLKLTSIRLPPGNPKGIDVLRAMPSLATINNLPATEFWERSDKKRK